MKLRCRGCSFITLQAHNPLVVARQTRLSTPAREHNWYCCCSTPPKQPPLLWELPHSDKTPKTKHIAPFHCSAYSHNGWHTKGQAAHSNSPSAARACSKGATQGSLRHLPLLVTRCHSPYTLSALALSERTLPSLLFDLPGNQQLPRAPWPLL